MGIIKLLLFSSLFYASLTFASITNIQISGVSVFELDPGTEAWGVLVGTYKNEAEPIPYPNCGFSLDNTATTTGTLVNPVPVDPSAPTVEFRGCHPLRVNGDTAVTITFIETSEVTSKKAIVYITPDDSDDDPGEDDVLTRSIVMTGTDQTFSMSFTWAELCQRIVVDDAGTLATFDYTTETCSHNGSLVLEFGVEDSTRKTPSSNQVTFHVYSPDAGLGTMNPTTAGCDSVAAPDFGFCDVSIFPGDEGGFLGPDIGGTHDNQISTNSTSFETFTKRTIDASNPSDSITLEVKKIQVYLSNIDCLSAQPNVTSTKVVERTVKSNAGNIATFEENDFSGLTNGVKYFVRAATVDQTGTVSQLFSDVYCPEFFSFSPSTVAGLIEENSCFITTATYGSDQAYQVNLFRLFRKKFLFTNALGHKIILLYNTYGPIGASWITEHPRSKGVIRGLLYPFYGFAYLSTHYGILIAFVIYSGFALVLLSLIRRKMFWKKG